MFDALKLKEKLLGGIGIILLLMLVMGAVAMLELRTIRQSLTDIVDDRYPKVVLSNQVIKRTLDNGRLVQLDVSEGSSFSFPLYVIRRGDEEPGSASRWLMQQFLNLEDATPDQTQAECAAAAQRAPAPLTLRRR